MVEKRAISQTVSDLLREKFAPEDRARVEELLLRYGSLPYHKDVERLRWLIATKAAWNVAQVERLVELALRDYRDAIMATEYELRDGKLVRVRHFPGG